MPNSCGYSFIDMKDHYCWKASVKILMIIKLLTILNDK